MRLIAFFIAFAFAFVAQAQDKSLTTSDGLNNIYTDKSGITIETRIIIEKEGEKAKIMFQQETENGFVFKNVNWKDDVTLMLDNGESIVLNKGKVNGSGMERGGYVGWFFVPDLYHRDTAFYLSEDECRLLKEHSVLLVSYYLDDKYDKKIHYLEISDKNQALKSQLTAIGK